MLAAETETALEAAFSGCTNLQALGAVKGFGFVSDYAFEGCASLQDFTFEGGTLTIGAGAFSGCRNLNKVRFIGDFNESAIKWGAFYRCSALSSAVLPEGIYRIDGYAFAACPNLKTLWMPDGFYYIGGHLLAGCGGFETMYVQEGSSALSYAILHEIPYKIRALIYGDVDRNGEINGIDAGLLLQYLADWDVLLDLAAADVNCDEEVNGIDISMILQYLADWDIELGKP